MTEQEIHILRNRGFIVPDDLLCAPPRKGAEPVPKRNKTFETIKTWLFIFAWLAPVFACTYWLDEDDKRMYKAYMQGCEQRKELGKLKADVDCNDEWRKAYKETFGR